MATRTARYRSHSPTPSPTHAYDHPQPFTPASTVGSMTLDTRSSQDNIYNGRNDLTLPPFSRNLVVGNGAPNSPRHTNYQQSYPISNPRDGKNYTRNNHPTPIPKNNVAREKHHYSYDDSNYSEFPQSKPPMDIQDPDLAAHRQLPSLGNPQYVNGSRSLPPINQAAYQPNYSTNLDTHRQRTLSINSIISSPGVSTPSTAYSSFGTPAHGNGTMKKRKKSFGTENGGEEDNIDSDDRERDGAKVTNGDGGGGGLNNTTSAAGLGLCLEDPDVRLAAEALGDLRADLNHSGLASRRQNHLQLSTTSSSSSSTTNTVVNSPLSPSQTSAQFIRYVNPEDAPLLDLIQNNPNPVLRAASAAGRLSAAAYTTSKTLSPGFRYAAEHVESVAKGRLGGAVGGLVSTVGKRSGLESLVRRSLAPPSAGTPLEGGKGSPDVSHDNRRLPPILMNGTAKKRKTSSGEKVEENGGMSSSSSTLGEIPEERKALQKQPQQDTQQQNWQTRLILSTPGIGAMSEESLKSLRFCLDWLRWANNHLGKCIDTMKSVLEEYERNKQSLGGSANNAPNTQSEESATPGYNAAVTTCDSEETKKRKQMLLGTIEYLKGEVLKTLKKVINVVDSYAGGALVGETRNMVKRQLLHLPQRLQLALVAHTPGTAEGGEQSGAVLDPTATAKRVIIVAKEGLDMMHNVSRLVEIALISAEEWCEKLGRKREPEQKSSNGGGGDEAGSAAGQGALLANKQITENGEKRERDSEGDVKMVS